MASVNPDAIPAEFRRILGVLSDHGVEFVVVRGIGAILQGAPLLSLDADIVPSQTDKNLLRLTRALVALKAEVMGAGPVMNVSVGDWLRASRFWNFSTELGRLDALMAPTGVEGYEALLALAVAVRLADGNEIKVASLDHLIAMKESAGRDKDRFALPRPSTRTPASRTLS